MWLNILWIVLGCVAAVLTVGYLHRHISPAAQTVVDWIAVSLDVVGDTLENGTRACGRSVAVARHEISRGGWPVRPLIAAVIAAVGAFIFVRGEFQLVQASAAALVAPETIDDTGRIVKPSATQLHMASAIAWVFVGGTLVLGSLPFVLLGRPSDRGGRSSQQSSRPSDRLGPLAEQPHAVRVSATVGVIVLSVIAVVCSVIMGLYRAGLSVSSGASSEVTGVSQSVTDAAAYAAGAGTAAITSIGSLAVGWAVDYVLMGVWLLLVALTQLLLRLLTLMVKIVADGAHRGSFTLVPAVVDAIAQLGQAPFGASTLSQDGPTQRFPHGKHIPGPGADPGDEEDGDGDGQLHLIDKEFAGWRIVSELPGADQSGMAQAVMLCRRVNPPLGEEDALYVIKLLRREPRMWRTWKKDVELASKVESAHAIEIVDFGRDHYWLWMVTPYYALGSLARYIRETRKVCTLEWSLLIVQQLLIGLEAVHDSKIIHLDIKPQNVLLASRGSEENMFAVLADFGLAKQLGDPNVSVTNHFQGTPLYCAPEQFSATAKDDRRSYQTDIYAMGSLLYWLITGAPALWRETQLLHAVNGSQMSVNELMYASHRPAKMDALVPGLPKKVAELADRWLSYVPAERTDGDAKAAALGALEALHEVIEELRATQPEVLRMQVGAAVAHPGLPDVGDSDVHGLGPDDETPAGW